MAIEWTPFKIVLLIFVILAVVAAVVLGVVYGVKAAAAPLELGTCPNGWIYRGNGKCDNPTTIGCVPSGVFKDYTNEQKKQWASAGTCPLNPWTNTAVLQIGEKAPNSGSVPIPAASS